MKVRLFASELQARLSLPTANSNYENLISANDLIDSERLIRKWESKTQKLNKVESFPALEVSFKSNFWPIC